MTNDIQFILYQLPEEEGKVHVVIKDETIWATQKAMAQLFDCSTNNIGLHLKKYICLLRTGQRFSYRENLGNCSRRKELFRLRQGNQTIERKITYVPL